MSRPGGVKPPRIGPVLELVFGIMVYDRQHTPTKDIFKNAGWDDADAYIQKMMADHRD